MLKVTPLNRVHRGLGARMVDFGGWDMPVQYAGVIEEHLATRAAAGLFDVSHMGEVEVSGANALDYIQYLTINDAARLVDGQVQYNAICYPDGGVVDDVTVYRFSATHYLFCVNASNTDKDFAWMEKVLAERDFGHVVLRNRSDEFAQLALQGPLAEQILARLTTVDLGAIRYYHFNAGEVAGSETIISRTGYTGEDGFELYIAAADAEKMWHALMTAGADDGLMPIGLGARDTLRLEMKYALYGHELSERITPLEAGLGWITKLDKGDFIGGDALRQQKEAGVPRTLVALRITESGIPRADYPLFCGEREVGVVTSGTMSPSLRCGIGLGLVASDCATIGTQLTVGIRKKRVAAQIVKPPFIDK